jgi:hypothetical protein
MSAASTASPRQHLQVQGEVWRDGRVGRAPVGDAVSAEYKTPGTFHGGTIPAVGITVEKASYEAIEMEAQRALARD